MKKILILLGITAIAFTSCETDIVNSENEIQNTEDASLKFGYYTGNEYFMVANRGASTVSVFNARTTDFVQDIALPDEGAQPTYLAHSRINNNVYVGDFANKKVVYYDGASFEQKGEIEIEEGAFHMWINDFAGQLWINNIVSKTTSVIDLRSNTVIKNIPLPTPEQIPGLTENAVQHDVTLSPSGYAAYVTVLDGPDTSYVVMYNTRTLEYIKHETVGGDAHLLPVGTKLYVPSQNSSLLTVFSRFNLNKLGEIPFESTHGVANSRRFVFTTGIADNKIGVIDRFRNKVVSEIDTDFNTPHNLAVNRRGTILFLAHSGGTATKVVFYKVKRNGKLEKISDFDSGLNPFGVLRY
ncbi:hypothetical protein D1816_03850 [Aquimarina sp. AD10]|uniref:YncE family protein n=1 Tax=Aquimarina sp. AD10 TaxID=1714849 RepID=UPI000E557FE8|nr:hypothetical protein [Aquimarina sp. AD10]AXT59521.1 hypothetical protein D1816_03850 [Aquimarina sp. AD10]RKN00422.1 hypothetical protein D7033_08680 [Aquimarina sp. AD10]